MKINLFGQRSKLGFGTLYAGLCDQLHRLSFLSTVTAEYIYLNPESEKRLVSNASPRDINIWFNGFMEPQVIQTKGRNVVWAMFETDKLAPFYIEWLNHGDLVWTASTWARNILLAHGLPAEKVAVVPAGVDGEVYHPHCRPRNETSAPTKFRFLIHGKFEERKGYKQLLDAFVKAFGGNPKVELLIKGDYYLNKDSKAAMLLDFVKSYKAPNIKLLTGLATQDDLFVIYNMADAFVFPSRAEGWGLPLIEAMATGLPTISTNYSGHTEFLSHVEGLFMAVNHKMVPIEDPEFRRLVLGNNGDWGHWAEADVDDLAQKMQEIVNNHAVWRQHALEASRILRARFNWANAAHIAIESLISAGLLPPVRFQKPNSISMI
jgi:glycosyltransferase involved in cell wall biosynthesis